MKDFANLDNSSGSFPDVIGVDASGPGETDGTELTADLFNDIMGAFQAILNEAGYTPSGTAESGSGISQIINSLKNIIQENFQPYMLGIADFMPNETTPGTRDWDLNISNAVWQSAVNSGKIIFPVKIPRDLSSHNVDINVNVTPAAARTGGNRILVSLYKNDTTLIDSTYDNGGTGNQDIEVSGTITSSDSEYYFVVVQAGNTGASQIDYLFHAKITIDNYPV